MYVPANIGVSCNNTILASIIPSEVLVATDPSKVRNPLLLGVPTNAEIPGAVIGATPFTLISLLRIDCLKPLPVALAILK
jgi:hypothetical protein